MNRIFFLPALGCLVVVLSSCGFFGDKGMLKNRSKDYLLAEPIKPLEAPNNQAIPVFDALYPIPNVRATDEFGDKMNLLEYKVPRPRSINSDKKSFGVKIQKLEGLKWIAIGASTSQVWPHTQSFLSNTDLGVVESDALSGRIETDWLQFKDDDSKMARFQIRLEKGIHPDTTELHVLEVEYPMGTEVPMPMVWPEHSVDPEREHWLMRQLAEHLARSIDNTSASLLGQNIGGELKAGFDQESSEPTLMLHLPAERAWATLTHASGLEAFRKWEGNESQGVIYVGYSEKLLKKRGFFRKLWSFGRKPLPENGPHALSEVLQHLSGASEVKTLFADIEGVEYLSALPGVQGYLIVLKRTGAVTRVVIRDQRGRKLHPAEAKEKMRMLRKNLI